MKNTKSTIPLKLREELNKDPEYQYCALTGERGTSADPIEWHHNLKFAGLNQQHRFCILPILYSVHKQADNSEMRERLDQIMIYRDTDELLFEPMGYSKGRNWRQREIYLNEKLGEYTLVTPKPAIKSPGIVTKAKSWSGVELSKKEWAIIFGVKAKLEEAHPDVDFTPRSTLTHIIESFSD